MEDKEKELTPEEALKKAQDEVVALKKANSELVDKNSDLTKSNKELAAANDALHATNQKCDADYSELEEKLKSLEKNQEEANTVIEELQKANADTEVVVKQDTVVVKHKKKSYRVIGKKVVYKKDRATGAVEISAEELGDHPEVVADLINRKSGVLVELKKD